MPGTRDKIVNALFYQAGWFALVLGAARGMAWIGIAVAAVGIAYHLWHRADRWHELRLMIAAAAIGAALDTANAALGVFRFLDGAFFCPPWLVVMWLLFATTFNESLSFLQRNLVLAAAFGAVGGPLAYWAGARFGAMEAGASMPLMLGVLAVEWALAMPLFAKLSASCLRTRGTCRVPQPNTP